MSLAIEHENLDQKAYRVIKNLIINDELPVAEKIPQEQLAKDLGISRTPLINALKLLEKEKLVEAIPRRGYVVKEFSVRDLITVFEVREVLEGLAARKAALAIKDSQIAELRSYFSGFVNKTEIDYHAYAREDRAFHIFILGLSDNSYLMEQLETCNIIRFSYRKHSAAGLVRPPKDTVSEHLAIIEAISARQPENAEAAMRIHLHNSLQVLLSESQKSS